MEIIATAHNNGFVFDNNIKLEEGKEYKVIIKEKRPINPKVLALTGLIKTDEDTENFKTWKFYDIEYDINNYKAITFEQAKEIYEFIKKNEGKNLICHCYAGVARSGAVGEFYWEMLGGSYKQLTEKFPNISPNGRVLSYLRIAEKLENTDVKSKINFV